VALTTDTDEVRAWTTVRQYFVGLEDEFSVLLLERVDPVRVTAVIEVTAREDASVGVSFLLNYSLIPTPYMVVLGVPVLLGAYLMARTSSSVIAAAEQRAGQWSAPVST
jgi:hypothetical protein